MDILICVLVAIAILYCIAREDKALGFVNRVLARFFQLIDRCKAYLWQFTPKGKKHRRAVDKMYRFAELKTVGDMFRYESTK